jgi:hypothetical protein
MARQQVKVECYSGSRADESPRRLTMGGASREIVRILDRAAVHDAVYGAESRHYRVLLDNGDVVDLSQSVTGDWDAEVVSRGGGSQ